MPSQNGRDSGSTTTPDSNFSAATESHSLTKRELEVVEWVVAGKRNREIGKILACSPRTVQKHVQHILYKLNLETRTNICIWWYESQLNGDGPGRAPRK